MPPIRTIIGYSLKHYAIVHVESKSKKGTKKAKEAAEAVVKEAKEGRIVTDSTFTGNDGVSEVWVVEYVRPADKDDLSTKG